MKIKLANIHPSSHRIRQSWDEQKLSELAESIRENGLLQPVKVRPDEAGYEIVYGHRRVEAARRAGLDEIEAMIETVDDTTALIQALIENVQREDMTPVDKAKALRALKSTTGWSQTEMARRGIMSQHDISVLLGLLDVPEPYQNLITAAPGGDREAGTLSVDHIANVRMSGLEDSSKPNVLDKALRENLTANQTRTVADAIAREPDPVVRDELIRRPFKGHEHTWEELARHKAEEDKELKQRQPSSLEWEMKPEVKVAFERIKAFEKTQLPEIEQMVEVGKFSPEGVQFLISRLRRLSATLADMANRLEAKHGG